MDFDVARRAMVDSQLRPQAVSDSLVIAAMAAEGTTLVDRIYHLDRGYDRMEVKLSQVGASIVRLK